MSRVKKVKDVCPYNGEIFKEHRFGMAYKVDGSPDPVYPSKVFINKDRPDYMIFDSGAICTGPFSRDYDNDLYSKAYIKDLLDYEREYFRGALRVELERVERIKTLSNFIDRNFAKNMLDKVLNTSLKKGFATIELTVGEIAELKRIMEIANVQK